MTTLEDRIMSELKAERAIVPQAIAAPIPTPSPKWPRNLAVAAVIVIVTAIAAVGILGQSSRYEGPVDTTDGHVLKLYARHDLIANELDVLVTTSSPVTKAGGHDIYVASIGSEPLNFTPDGEEMPIVQRPPDIWQGRHSGVIGPVVYLGDVDGQEFTLFSRTTNSLPGFLGRWISTLSREQLLCVGEPTGSACVAGWGTGDVVTGGSTGPTDGPFTHHLVWAGLPSETAVVSWELADGVVFWQRPAGLVSAMTFETGEPGAVVRTRAFTADGAVLLERTTG